MPNVDGVARTDAYIYKYQNKDFRVEDKNSILQGVNLGLYGKTEALEMAKELNVTDLTAENFEESVKQEAAAAQGAEFTGKKPDPDKLQNKGAQAEADAIAQVKAQNAAMTQAQGAETVEKGQGADGKEYLSKEEEKKFYAAYDKLKAAKTPSEIKKAADDLAALCTELHIDDAAYSTLMGNRATEEPKFGIRQTVETEHTTATQYNNGTWIVTPKVPTEKKNIKSKREYKKEIRESARFTDRFGFAGEKGKVYTKEDELKTAYKTIKEKAKADKKAAVEAGEEFQKLRKEYAELRRKGTVSPEFLKRLKDSQSKVARLAAISGFSNKAKMEVELAYDTASGKNDGKLAKIQRRLDKRENAINERKYVFATKEDMDAAIAQGKVKKENCGYYNTKTYKALWYLQTLGREKLEGNKDLNHPGAGVKLNPDGTIAAGQEFTADQIKKIREWGSLAQIQMPEPGDSPEVIAAKTRKNQSALMALAGFDNAIDPTEKRHVKQEVKEYLADKISFSVINELNDENQIDHTDRLKYRFNDANNGLFKNLPTAVLASLFAYGGKVTAVAKATASSKATAHLDEINMLVEDFETVYAHAYTEIPGFSYIAQDPETREQILMQVAGKYSEDTQKAVAHAVASLHVDEQNVTVTDTATAESVATKKASPARAFWTFVGALGAGYIMDFLTSKGDEKGVGSNVKEYKMTQFVEMHDKGAAKQLAQQIMDATNELAEKIAGPNATDEEKGQAFAQASEIALSYYESGEGLQNGVMNLDELKGTTNNFLEVVKDYKPKQKVAVEKGKVDNGGNNGDQVDNGGDDNDGDQTESCPTEGLETTYHYEKRGGDSWYGLIEAFYPDCLTKYKKGTRAYDAAIYNKFIPELKRVLANGDKDTLWHLRHDKDLPATLDLPETLFDCSISKGTIQKRKMRYAKGKGSSLDNAGVKNVKIQNCEKTWVGTQEEFNALPTDRQHKRTVNVRNK